VRPLGLRDLNRALLARQLLLDRTRTSVTRAVTRLVAMQAQYALSPYVALWSRVDGFRKDQLTRALAHGAIVKGVMIRATLHVTTAADFPFVVSAHIESQRGRVAGLGTDRDALAAALPDRPLDARELFAIAGDVLGTTDRWTIAFTLRAMPFVRTAPIGDWPHNKVSPSVLWREALPTPGEAAIRVVQAYLAGYGPASRADVEQFTGFRVAQIEPALEGLPTHEEDDGRTLYDVPRGELPPADTRVPVRFLPPFDSIILAHRDRSRILPKEYRETVIRKKNATTLATFTVDGFVAGSWKVERARGAAKLTVEPFAPIPRGVRKELDAEGERLVAFYES